jgi:hypothetical protein
MLLLLILDDANVFTALRGGINHRLAAFSLDTEIFQQKLQLTVSNTVIELGLAHDSHEAGDLQLSQILNASLVDSP